jgi:uncharacterized repeat protein (TIGR01451 family)
MLKHYPLVAVLVIAVVAGLAGQVLAGHPASSAVAASCSPEPWPQVDRLQEGDILQTGLQYLVKGPRRAIADTFPEILWQDSFVGSSHGAALVVPSADLVWPPEGFAISMLPLEPDTPDTYPASGAWRIVEGWRTPFLMYTPLDEAIDVVNLGLRDAGWAISAQALDHLNQYHLGVERRAWLYLVRADGTELLLDQLEVADPAFSTVVLPEPGEVQIRTHDSTIWWVQCLPPPSIAATKTANPVQVPEPGDTVEFTVRVDNSGPLPLTLTSLVDDLYGEITTGANPLIKSTTCTVPQPLALGAHYTCSFTADVAGQPGDTETDTVAARAVDEFGRGAEASDSATVTILDVPSAIHVTKNAYPTSVAEPGGDVQFRVVVENTSAVDHVTIQSLVDDQFGDLAGYCDSALPATLAPDEEITCNFGKHIAGNPGYQHANTATATGVDDDGQPVHGQGSALVTVENVPSQIEVIKTAFPDWLYLPGDDVEFSFTVNNLSTVDWVTIESLTDTVFGDLNGRGDCSVPQTLGPGGSYACSFTTFVGSEVETVHTNVVTAAGTDDDGYPVSDDDSAEVEIKQPPAAVELLYFRSTVEGARLVVEWATAMEQDNWGFNLYRGQTPSFEAAAWIHFIQAEGMGQFEGQAYRYDDTDAVRGQTYYYWLEDVEMGGATTQHGPLRAAMLFRIFVPLAGR